MKSILSPITGLPNIKIVASIPKEVIIRSYSDYLEVLVERFFYDIDRVDIVKCLDTGYLFYYPFFIYGDEKFYDDLKIQMPYKFNVPYYSENKWEYMKCLNLIFPNDNVHEIGCGNGFFLKKLIDKGIRNVSGSELNLDSVNVAKKEGLNVEYITVEDKAKVAFENFDVVCIFQVLEHVYDVKSFLNASIELLKKDGRLMLGVPNNDPYLFKRDIFNTLNMPPHHMGLWNKMTFENLPKFFPLQLESINVEGLPSNGYDFEQFYKVNKGGSSNFRNPFKIIYNVIYYWWLKLFHSFYAGKNIIAIFRKI